MISEELLDQLATLMFVDGKWHARLRGTNVFAEGQTAKAAVAAAQALANPTEDDDEI